jgi:dTDP-glucose 4,6-dehydratase
MLEDKSRVLVTGGAGFLGSHLCWHLLSAGYFVVCLDNLITGNRDNIAEFETHKRFEFINHDISQPLKLRGDIDWVFHFASLASPKSYLKYPIKTLKSGLLGTYNCLGFAKAKSAKFFLASTSEVYGDPKVHPQPEGYWGNVNPVGPRGCYDESKRAAEALTYAYMREHDIDVRVVRIFNTYGPRMNPDDGRVVSNFITQALRGDDLTVYGRGEQTRSFCYVDDLIKGIIAMMGVDYKWPLNLGNPHEFKIIAAAKKILELTHSKSKIKYLPLPQDDPQQRQPDITRAKEILSWKPGISFEQGVGKTIEYFKKVTDKDAHR